MNARFRRSISKPLAAMSLLIISGISFQARAYVISTEGGIPTEGWDGPGLGAVTIDYYLGWSGAPNNGLTFGSLSLAQVETELANAMATWSAVVDVTFNYLGNPLSNPMSDPWGSPGDETLVVYSHGSESSNAFPFDGAGLSTVFAHAWGPPDISTFDYRFAGNIHMDSAENWLTGMADGTTYSSQGGIDLETIFLHELGHSLGLGHVSLGNFATVGGAVMAEYSNIALSTLGADDIAGVRQLYSFQGQDWSNGDPGDDDETPVPEPGTLLLFGTGLLAMAGFRRRFQGRMAA